MFGPDATAEFLKTNGLSLVLRSHEGPDAREDREGMDNMHAGFSVDHDIENVGKLCTVFSAPDYPQFIEAGDTRHNNAATFVRLRGGTEWAEPEPTAFTAARPRPGPSAPRVTVGGSDEEGPDGGSRARRARGRVEDEVGREETAALEEEAGPEAPAAAEAMEAEDDEGPTPSSQEDTEEIPSWPRSRPR